MARNSTGVLLGFEDEIITEKYKEHLNFTVNKIGGIPDFPASVKLDPPKMSTLSTTKTPRCPDLRPFRQFGISSNPTQEKIIDGPEDTTAVATKTNVTDWCVDADDWDDNNANFNEENGNIINNIVMERVSDEDEESCSLEDSIRSGFGSLTIDDRNANNGAHGM
ncbi:hypothetical protein NQ314_014036 [Rhamnusium bicolor]|uniref:Uncharacterized protein n=1 Tax=Rhamnusium bicolor TaxID=1586634 RepID=A0AAV8X4U1_9CUCU|nr:hypothetical protein NQ314_014036 [Rhamnusium bicolor]